MAVTANDTIIRKLTLTVCDTADWFAYKVAPSFQRRRQLRQVRDLLTKQKFFDAESLLYRILRYTRPSNQVVVDYTVACILKEKSRTPDVILSANNLDHNQRKLLGAAVYFARGEFERAKEEISQFTPETSLLSAEIMRLRFLVARQAGDDTAAASLGRAYMEIKKRPDIGVTASLITLGERLGDKNLVSTAITEAKKDARRIKRDGVLFAENWERLIHFWLTMFDPEAAHNVAQRAVRRGFKKARRARGRVRSIIQDISEIQGLIDQAKLQLVDLGEGREVPAPHRGVTFVVASAMLNYRKHDPESFRPSLRLIYKEITKALRDHDMESNLVVKIDSRSDVGTTGSGPYISYHTTSPRRNGLHFKEAYYPGTFSFDRTGYSGWSEISDLSLADLDIDSVCPPNEVERFYKGLQISIAANASKYRQNAIDLEANLPQKFVFVGLQVISDSVQKLARILMLEMLDEVASANAKRGISTVVKRHPLCRSSFVRETLFEGESLNRWIVSSASVHDLVARSSGVCVVNSGVGIEALAHLKPVYLFGKADYRHVCYDMTRRGHYHETFQEDVLPVSPDTIKKYLYYFRNVNLIDLEDQETAAHRIRRRLDQYLGEAKLQMKSSTTKV